MEASADGPGAAAEVSRPLTGGRPQELRRDGRV